MIRDSKAEELETKGLYRRAAARWAEVMQLVNTDKEREQAAKRRAECIRKAARPPVKLEQCDAKAAISRTQKEMGLHQPNGSAFRKWTGD